MGQDIITTDRAPGHLALATLALNPRRWTTVAARSLAGADAEDAIAAAAVKLDGDLAPVPSDPALRADWRAAMDERLRRLAVKIAPGMSPEQAQPWRDVMVDALADLPAMVALTAAKRAIHRPMRFLNEVEQVVREIAATVILERRAAKARLELFARSLRQAGAAALPPQAEDAPLSPHEIRALPKYLRDMGLRHGWLTPEAVETADREAA